VVVLFRGGILVLSNIARIIATPGGAINDMWQSQSSGIVPKVPLRHDLLHLDFYIHINLFSFIRAEKERKLYDPTKFFATI
jgi:hypothetical protein